MKYNLMHYLHPVITGGGEDLLVSLAGQDGISSRKETIVVLGCRNSFLETKLTELGVSVVSFSLFNSQQQYSKKEIIWRCPFQMIFLFLQVANHTPKVLHLHSFPAQYLGQIFRAIGKVRGKSIRVGFTKHIYSQRGTISRFIWRHGTRGLDFFSAVSESAMRGVGLEKSARSSVIFNPADPRFFQANYKTADTKSLKACIGSRIVSGKGHIELFELLSNSDFEGKTLSLSVFGSGPLEELCRNAADSAMGRNPNLRIVFEGLLTTVQLIKSLEDIDFAFHPSQNEGFSLMCAQYHALGMPTLCYDYGPSREVFEDRAEYYASFRSFQQGLRRMLDYEYRAIVSPTLLQHRDSFRIEKIWESYQELYRLAHD